MSLKDSMLFEKDNFYRNLMEDTVNLPFSSVSDKILDRHLLTDNTKQRFLILTFVCRYSPDSWLDLYQGRVKLALNVFCATAALWQNIGGI